MSLHYIGPYYRQVPTAFTTNAVFDWCYLLVDDGGYLRGIEWIGSQTVLASLPRC